MAPIERLKKWVEGECIHVDGEDCLPDFSCCKPELLAPKEERELFLKLWIEEKHSEYEKMLMMFLGRSIPILTNKKVYISGGKP